MLMIEPTVSDKTTSFMSSVRFGRQPTEEDLHSAHITVRRAAVTAGHKPVGLAWHHEPVRLREDRWMVWVTVRVACTHFEQGQDEPA